MNYKIFILLTIFILGTCNAQIGKDVHYDANTQQMYPIFDEQFNDNSNNWTIQNNKYITEKLLNGFYYFTNHTTKYQFGEQKRIELENDNFIIETSIQKISGVQNNGYGLRFGSVSGNKYSFLITGNGIFSVVMLTENGTRKVIKSWTKSEFVNQGNGELNNLSILKEGNILKYFINNKFVFKAKDENTVYEVVGIEINDNQKIAIDYLKVSSSSLATVNYNKFLKEENQQTALTYINKTIELNPNNDKYYCERAHTNRKLNKYKDAVNDYTKAIELDSKHIIYYKRRAEIYLKLGKENEAIKDYTAIIEYYTELIDKNPDLAYYYIRGFYYKKIGKINEANIDFAIAVKKANIKFALLVKNTTDLKPILVSQRKNTIAWVQCFANDITEAIINVNLSISALKSANNLDTRATAYGIAGNYSKALDDLNEAIKISPNKSLIIYKRGLVKQALNDNLGAKQDFEKALEFDRLENYLYKEDPLIYYLADDINSINNQLPPILTIYDISFSEMVLDAEETAKLLISIINSGPGDANKVYVSLSGAKKGLEYPEKSYFPVIKANGGKEEITINIKGNLDLPTAEALINIEVVEPNFKVNIKGKQLKFPTSEFQKPKLILAQHVLTENQSANPNKQIDINEMVDLKFAIQNIGQGDADNVKIDVSNNQKGVMLLGVVKGAELNRDNPIFSKIQPGEFETVTYRYFINSEFSENELQFNIESKERIGKYGFSLTKSFPINKQIKETGYIRTIAQTKNYSKRKVVIKDIPDFIVDVDTEIPVSSTKQTNTYALIIGNEDYKSKQRGLTVEQNVDFAINDAQVFKLYCDKTLGIPNNQIRILKDATSAEISQGLAWINNLSKIENGNARLIFYYSGHGLPDEQTKEPYLIPVDVSGTNLKYGIKLADVYKDLTQHPAKQITVFLDACFSGGARNQGLLAMKGIKVKPKKDIITGNMVVFTSSSGDESSAVYREKQHGYFTYYLLKSLKETQGQTDYNNLSNYIINSVRKEAGLSGKIQTPQVNVSLKVENEWKLWKLK